MIPPQRTEKLGRLAVRLAASAALAALALGCALDRQPAEPAVDIEKVTVLGIPNARFWPDTDGAALLREGEAALAREVAARAAAGLTGPLPPADYLAVSGGSDDGAFAVGLLAGWKASGTRPEFKLVTGVSTGSLVAPFAFLGGSYDDQISRLYTSIGPSDIYDSHGILQALFKESLNDTTPLYQLISRNLDSRMLAAIAAEYQKGRLLFIGTTNIDQQRPVIWNIGAIAATGRPEALTLVHRILLASAAVPGVFPPVIFDVEVGGRHYQEMHVDGGAVAQTFLYPPQIGRLVDLRNGRYARERHAYIIRCGRLDPGWATTERHLLPIAGRAIDTMIHYSGANDVLRIYNTTKHDGVDYNLAYIGADFNQPHPEPFGTAYMRALFDYAYRASVRGYHWAKEPPILDVSDKR